MVMLYLRIKQAWRGAAWGQLAESGEDTYYWLVCSMMSGRYKTRERGRSRSFLFVLGRKVKGRVNQEIPETRKWAKREVLIPAHGGKVLGQCDELCAAALYP